MTGDNEDFTIELGKFARQHGLIFHYSHVDVAVRTGWIYEFFNPCTRLSWSYCMSDDKLEYMRAPANGLAQYIISKIPKELYLKGE